MLSGYMRLTTTELGSVGSEKGLHIAIILQVLIKYTMSSYVVNK